MGDVISTEREHEHERSEDIASNIHDAMRDVRDKNSDVITAQLLNMVQSLQDRLLNHMMEERAVVQELKDGLGRVETKIVSFISAFPNGDAVLHRRAHEEQMTEVDRKKEFWEKIKFTLVALALTAVTSWIVVVVWKAFLVGPKG